MNPYIMLGAAIVSEVFAETCMKLSEGFAKKAWIAGIVGGYVVSFYLLAGALTEIPLGMAYAIWSGVGIVLTAVNYLLEWPNKYLNRQNLGQCHFIPLGQ